MRLLLFISIFAAQWAYCATRDSSDNDAPPAPISVSLPAIDRERANVLINDLLARVRSAEAREKSEQGLLAESVKEEANAEKAVQEIQRKLDKDAATIAAQAKQLADLKTFARVVLACIFALGFAGAWKLTAAVSFVPPWGIAIRLAICLAAGALASGAVWRIITRLL